MKFAFKSIVVAAAFVAAGAANAAVVTIDGVASAGDQYTVSGAGSLTFSSLLRSALNVGTVQASAYGDAVANITTSPTTGAYTGITVGAPVVSVTYDDVSNRVTRVITTGGARQVAGYVEGVSFGGTVDVGELDVRFNYAADGSVSGEIYGNVVGKSLAGVEVNFIGQKLFDIAGTKNSSGAFILQPIVGSTAFNLGSTTTALNGLKITDAGFSAISTALDLDELGINSLNAAAKNFGNISSTINVAAVAAIPEPSTYALMGLGLVGIGFAARRRAAK